MTTPDGAPAVVAGIDGSDTALGAARWAADFAGKQRLPLTLIHAIPKLDWHFISEPPAELGSTADGDAVLAAAEAAVRSKHPDLVIRTDAVKGGVAAVLAGASQSARLLVVGQGAAGHRVLGGNAVRIAHLSACPVVIWRPALAVRTGKPLPIVVGVDESETSNHALAEAFAIARTLHAPLTVAHMWDLSAAVGMGDLGGQGLMDWQLLEMLQTQQREQMDKMVKPLTFKYPNAHVNKVFHDTSPAKGLAELSREAQLVIVGSHGRGRLADSVLGSVSQSLIHHAECPVLVVRGV